MAYDVAESEVVPGEGAGGQVRGLWDPGFELFALLLAIEELLGCFATTGKRLPIERGFTGETENLIQYSNITPRTSIAGIANVQAHTGSDASCIRVAKGHPAFPVRRINRVYLDVLVIAICCDCGPRRVGCALKVIFGISDEIDGLADGWRHNLSGTYTDDVGNPAFRNAVDVNKPLLAAVVVDAVLDIVSEPRIHPCSVNVDILRRLDYQ
jgi:hypothetical protein